MEKEKINKMHETTDKLLLNIKKRQGDVSGCIFSNKCIRCEREGNILIIVKKLRGVSLYCKECSKEFEGDERFNFVNLK